MEAPGMSLFQGAASININNSAQDRLEEQEELEDQKRRTEELKRDLENAFDDLVDDDEASSLNSSGNFTMDGGGHRSTDIHMAISNQQQTPSGRPPTYIESLTHLKEQKNNSDSPKIYCETPKSTASQLKHDEILQYGFSPYGAGDGQNPRYHQEIKGHQNGINSYEARQEYMNTEQLKVMYEMRVKECQQMAIQMDKLDKEVDSLRVRLLAAINDKDKTEMSLQEAQHLLASSKHKLIEMEQQVTTLAEKLVESEQDKEQMKLELRSANISLQDVQQRLHTMQVAHSHDTDALFREQQDRHRDDMERMQNDLTKAKNRLEEKENEIKSLERRCKEKDREKEDLMIEKGATINRLAKELEAAQSRLINGESARLKEKVAQLSSERNAAKEQVKELGSKLEVTAHELVLCRNKLTANQKEHETWQNMLHQILVESLPDNLFIGDSQSPGKLSTLKEVLNRYKQQLQKLSTMQEELAKRDKRLEQHRKTESELRAKLEESKGVEMQLNSRLAVYQNKLELLGNNGDSELLESYKLQNEDLQNELENVRTQLKNLDLKYTELDLEHEKLKLEKGSRASLVQEANADLLHELERCSGQLKELLKENGELKNLYLQACSSRDAMNRELKDTQSKILKEKDLFKSQEKEYTETLEGERRKVEKLTSELDACREELERANKRISELQKEFTDKQKEFADKLNKFIEDEKIAFKKDTEPCVQCGKHAKHIKSLEEQISKFNIKLACQSSNETLMNELRGKAEFFQHYILERFKRLNEQRSIGVNTEDVVHEPSTTRAASPPHADLDVDENMVQNCEDVYAAKTTMMMKEKAIREQIAEKFTLEIKTLEMNSARQIKEIEDEHLATVGKLKELLERKAKEIDTMKEFILAERTKVTEILESKENEISELIKEHNELQRELEKSRENSSEWKSKAEKYKERLSRLMSLEEAMKKEREDWKAKNSINAKEWQAMKKKVLELHEKLEVVEEKYETLKEEHKNLQEKYKNAKRTVFTYKDYIVKKDAHVNNELSRIADEYRVIFTKLQNQLNHQMNCRIREEKNRAAVSKDAALSLQPIDCSIRMEKLKEDLNMLTKDLNEELGHH